MLRNDSFNYVLKKFKFAWLYKSDKIKILNK